MMGDAWYTSPPPKDREVIVEVTRETRAIWNDELKTYVLAQPLHIEDDPVPRRWREHTVVPE